MSILKTKYFSGWGYTNPKGKDRKIKKLERTYIKFKRGVKLYYDFAHYDEYEIDDDYGGEYEKYEVRKIFRKSIQLKYVFILIKSMEVIYFENFSGNFGQTYSFITARL